MSSPVDGGSLCKPRKDFLRHIANRVIAEYASKLPHTTIEDLRKMLSTAEDKFKFSVYGGNPANILNYFSSEDWANLVDYAKNTHSEEALVSILRKLAQEYSEECPEVAAKALEEAERVERLAKEGVERAEGLSPSERVARTVDKIIKKLKLMGYKFEVKDSTIVINEGIIKVEIRVEANSLRYVICKEGVARSLDGVLAKLERVREI